VYLLTASTLDGHSTLIRSRGARAVLAKAPEPPIATKCKENNLKLSHALADHGSWNVAAANGWDTGDMRKLLWASSDWQQELIQRQMSHRLHRGLGYHTVCARRSRPTWGTIRLLLINPFTSGKAAYSRQFVVTLICEHANQYMFSNKVAMQSQACKPTCNLRDARQ